MKQTGGLDVKTRTIRLHDKNTEKFIIIIGLCLVLTLPIINAASITLVASKNEYNPGDALVVLGTSTPGSAVAIQVYNPEGVLIAVNQVETRDDGQYVIEVFNWPDDNSLNLVFGIYEIKAVDAASEETTIIDVIFAESTSTPVIPVIKEQDIVLQIVVSTSSTYQLEDEVRGVILFKVNGSQIEPIEKTVSIFSFDANGFSSEILNLIPINEGMYYFEYIPNKIGTYIINAEGSVNGSRNIEISTFQVIERFVTQSNLDDLQNTLDNSITLAQNEIIENFNNELALVQSNLIDRIISTQSILQNSTLSIMNSIENTIEDTISFAVIELNSQIESTEESLLKSIEDTQNQVDLMENNLDSINIGVSNSSVWITVVGLIAIITLVSQLVIFVRKIS